MVLLGLLLAYAHSQQQRRVEKENVFIPLSPPFLFLLLFQGSALANLFFSACVRRGSFAPCSYIFFYISPFFPPIFFLFIFSFHWLEPAPSTVW